MNPDENITKYTLFKVAPEAVVALDTVNNRDSTCSSGMRHGVDFDMIVLCDFVISTSFAAPDHDDAFFFTVCLCWSVCICFVDGIHIISFLECFFIF